MSNPSAATKRHRVVIIGSGFGALRAAKALKNADVDITLISLTTTHLFQPLRYQVATGILSEGEIAPLLDAASAVLPPMGPKLGLKVQPWLARLGVEIQLNATVTNVDYKGITIKDTDGTERRIECACKVWSAGVQASPLGTMIAAQSEGAETDRAGRVVVQPDLTVKGHPQVFVVGDLMAMPGVPGMAQGAIQGANYAAKLIKRSLTGNDAPATREPFNYFNKGSMATVSRFDAVAQMGKLEFSGFIAWLAWLVLHLFYLVGHKNRFTTVVAWFITFLGHGRGQLAITSQMIYAGQAMERLRNQYQESN